MIDLRLAILALSAVLVGCAAPAADDLSRGGTANCNPPPDSKQAQYVIGYGSLMQDESRKRTAPRAGAAYPVVGSGYRRGWFAKGGSIGFDTTYLGIVEGKGSKLNAVIYEIDAAEIAATDIRELVYCRRGVDVSQVTALAAQAPAAKGQIWIYVNPPESLATPSARYPIVQSYVDIVVSGCLEQEERFALADFALQCLASTTDWSLHWVNDRIYPRRPLIHQPRAGRIDKLLAEHLPEYFHAIRIESGQ